MTDNPTHRCKISSFKETELSFMVALIPALPIPEHLNPREDLSGFAVIAANHNPDSDQFSYVSLTGNEKECIGEALEARGETSTWLWCTLFAKTSYTDEERINFLQKIMVDEGKYSGKVILRESTTGRGPRLHETQWSGACESVRETIDAMMESTK